MCRSTQTHYSDSEPTSACSQVNQEQVNFQCNDDEVHFVLDQHSLLDFYSACSLKQQSADSHVAHISHIILIPSQSILALSPTY